MNHATTPETPNSSAVSEFPRCRLRMSKGRCREIVSDPATGLCFKHAAQHKKDCDSADVAPQLIRDTDDFTSAVTINRSLTELYKLLASDKISPRRGAVMAYTCSLLLRTLNALDEELNPDNDQIIFDLPRPKRDDDISPEPAMVNGMAELGACCKTPVAPDGYDGWSSDLEKSK